MASSVPARRLYRRRNGRLLAGVAGGLSEHLGIDVLVLRIGFVVTIALGGLGVLLYAAFWAVVPPEPDEVARADVPTPRGQLLSFAALGATMLVVAQLIGFNGSVLWPAAAAVTGAAIVWRQADEGRRERLRALTRGARSAAGTSRRRTTLRYAAGLVLVMIGMTSFLFAHGELSQARRALLPVSVAVLGLILVIGPWTLQAVSQLNDERTARIREQERVELAGRVHDSMLQTLTLIQRRADDADEVRRLVRHSQREIRGFLYPSAPTNATVRTAITELCAEIEDEYAVTIDLVVVGDHATTEPVQPMLQALREAAINAAKHSGVSTIDIYVEVAATDITAYVRDRGRGFEPADVPPDRFGVRESVIARMKRNGGDAVIRSSPETGTEVRLTLPLRTAAPA